MSAKKPSIARLLLTTLVFSASTRMRPTLRLFSRSAWKGPHFVAFPDLRESIARNIPIYTMARSCTVLPNFVGAKFMIHNGKTYIPITVTQEMVGHKLGEFAPTRKPFTYKPSQKR